MGNINARALTLPTKVPAKKFKDTKKCNICDFSIEGQTLNLYQRLYKIHSCDEFTRQYLLSEGRGHKEFSECFPHKDVPGPNQEVDKKNNFQQKYRKDKRRALENDKLVLR